LCCLGYWFKNERERIFALDEVKDFIPPETHNAEQSAKI
jgi:hypothetical protein